MKPHGEGRLFNSREKSCREEKMNGPKSRPARSKRSDIRRLKSIESTISSGHDLELANLTSESSENLEGMGIFRSEGDRILVSHGSVSVCGRRREMEDTVTVAPGLVVAGDSVRYDFFGVYDGHGGSVVAEACRERMHGIVEREVKMRGGGGGGGGEVNWKDVMESCFEQMDGEILEKTIGSTAVVAMVGMGKVVVANCGDSRAVLSRGGVAVPLSRDHKPDRPDEMERVEAAGGRVINWDGYRVLGVLATSRSIGDHYLKPYVISEPEVVVTGLMERDEFLILASDGLWDVVSNDMACEITRRCLADQWKNRFMDTEGGSVATGTAEAAALLAEIAMSRGSKDNISIVIVELRQASGR